ncbi:MAG TPA: hypothetical protein VIR58_12875 [Acidimicrobiales bacterium]
MPSTSAEEVSASTRKWLDRISDAIDVTDGIRLIVDGTVAVPPGLVAADGVELRVGLQIVSSDAGEGSVRGGAPELVVEVSQGDSYPGLRSAAWRGLQVPERWILLPDEATILVELRDSHGSSTERRESGLLTSQGRGWRCHLVVPEVFSP